MTVSLPFYCSAHKRNPCTGYGPIPDMISGISNDSYLLIWIFWIHGSLTKGNTTPHLEHFCLGTNWALNQTDALYSQENDSCKEELKPIDMVISPTRYLPNRITHQLGQSDQPDSFSVTLWKWMHRKVESKKRGKTVAFKTQGFRPCFAIYGQIISFSTPQ